MTFTKRRLRIALSPFFTDKQKKQRQIASHTLWASIHGLCFLQETGKIPLVDNDQKAAGNMAVFLIETFISGLRDTDK